MSHFVCAVKTCLISFTWERQLGKSKRLAAPQRACTHLPLFAVASLVMPPTFAHIACWPRFAVYCGLDAHELACMRQGLAVCLCTALCALMRKTKNEIVVAIAFTVHVRHICYVCTPTHAIGGHTGASCLSCSPGNLRLGRRGIRATRWDPFCCNCCYALNNVCCDLGHSFWNCVCVCVVFYKLSRFFSQRTHSQQQLAIAETQKKSLGYTIFGY